jgi:fused signal recognition particle receptor
MMDDEEEVPAEDMDMDMGDEEEVADEVPAEEGSYSEDDEMDDEEMEEENLDLEAIIKELEDELSEGEDAEEVEESTESTESVEESTEEVDEEIEIDENALTEEEGDEEEEEEVEESNTSALESELKEYKEAVSFLKDKLHEVNILNAKLLFTNKLFKAYSLDNNQKLKVVETFDRAQTTREIKLVYSTLAEQFADNGSIVNKKSISESASAPVASTKPAPEAKKVISEEVEVANRFKKLAGLL